MRSDAQKRADREYMDKNYSTFSVKMKKNEYNAISAYCKKMNISKARFVVWACNYFMGQGILPPESEVDQTEDYSDSDNNEL